MKNALRSLSTSMVLLIASQTAWAIGDDFSSNPLAGGSPWSFGIGSNANNQFSWQPGQLLVDLNSSLPTARFDSPLGTTYTDTDSFLLSARFQFTIHSAPGDQFMQISFGLTNQSLTGGDRTGSFSNFSSDNVFHTVEFTYFPNVSTFGGPALSPAVFGAQVGGGDAFSNFASIFGSASDLGDNTVGVKSLAQNTWLEARLSYNGATKTANLDMYEVLDGGALSLINTELVPLDLAAFGSPYDTANPFQVDTLSIMAYHDGFTTSDAPSLVATLTFDNINVVPEPSSMVLAAIGLLLLPVLAKLRR